MPIALAASRADLKRFSRAIRSRSPRSVRMSAPIARIPLHVVVDIYSCDVVNCIKLRFGRNDVAKPIGLIRLAAAATLPRALAVDARAPAPSAPALETRGAGARDRCRVGGHRERGDRQDPSPRHRPPVALRRRARAAARAAKDSGRGSAAPRAPARLLVAPGPAGGAAPQQQTLGRERAPRRGDPALPAPRLVRAGRSELQMARWRSRLAVVLLLRRGGAAHQAILRPALYAGLSAPATTAAARACRRVRQADNTWREAAWSR